MERRVLRRKIQQRKELTRKRTSEKQDPRIKKGSNSAANYYLIVVEVKEEETLDFSKHDQTVKFSKGNFRSNILPSKMSGS